MTNPTLYYEDDMAEDNKLQTEDSVQAAIDAALATSGLPFFNNAISYNDLDIVYYNGLWYIANGNISAGGGTPLANANWNNLKHGFTTTATAAGTTTLTKNSSKIQRFSGTTTQTVKLPVVTTLPTLDTNFLIINDSTGAVTVQSSGSNNIVVLSAGQRAFVQCILLTGTTAASWTYILSATTIPVGDALVANPLSQFASTTSAQLAGVLSDETGTGVVVFNISPTLVTPILGVASATTINKITLTAPATGATLTIANGKTFTANATITLTGTDGKTLTISNSITFAGTDGTVMTFPNSSASIARIDAAQAFTGTQTFNNYIQLSEAGGILMDQTLSADGAFSIAVGEIGTLGETLSFGHLVYFKAADSRWWKCDSDAEATAGPVKLGIVCVAGTAGQDCQIMLRGKIRADSLFPTFTVGAPVHIGATAGEVVVTAPTSGIVRVIGHADTADSLSFNPDTFYEELGTFTPNLTFGLAAVGMTFTNQTGRYSKIRRNCWFNFYITLSAKGSSTGLCRTGNLPFTNLTGSENRQAVSLTYWNAIISTTFPHGQCTPNTSYIDWRETTSAGSMTSLDDTDFANSSEMVVSGKIFV